MSTVIGREMPKCHWVTGAQSTHNLETNSPAFTVERSLLGYTHQGKVLDEGEFDIHS